MSDLLEIRMPADQSEGTRSQVLRWLKTEGETVSQDEPLIEMETDKVTVEIAAPHAGVLRQILKPEQSDVEPGELLGLIEPEGAAHHADAHSDPPVGRVYQAADSAAAANGIGAQRTRSDATGAHAGAAASSNAYRGAVEAHTSTPSAASPPAERLESQPTTRAHDTAADVSRRIQHANATGGGTSHSNANDGGASNRNANSTSAPSPAVRRLLSESGLSASDVVGTGVGGRITVDDVLAHKSRGDVARPSSSTAAAQTSTKAEKAAPGTRRVPHSAVRKRVAEHMVRSLLHTAPHVTSVFEADMSAVIAHRARHRDEFKRNGAPLTFTAYFLSAIVDAIRAVPEANSRWTDDALEIYDAINIGVGTALGDQGLVVPVIQHVESMTLPQIANALNTAVTRAREGRLTPEDVRGGTFTISNHGVSGSLIATPIIINQPQSAILGIGKLDQRVVPAKEGGAERFTVVPKCYVTLTIDHRVMDGFQANRFLQTFVGKLESWSSN
jgi:2-oxoglutarate dehydrogenase E2 component (dihydrolipoamide succinyltransferase)